MANKGYASEYAARKILEKGRDPQSVVKTAISQIGADYIVYSDDSNRIDMVVEVKCCHQKKKYYSQREKDQLEHIKSWCVKRKVPFYIYIHYPKERRWHKEQVI